MQYGFTISPYQAEVKTVIPGAGAFFAFEVALVCAGPQRQKATQRATYPGLVNLLCTIEDHRDLWVSRHIIPTAW